MSAHATGGLDVVCFLRSHISTHVSAATEPALRLWFNLPKRCRDLSGVYILRLESIQHVPRVDEKYLSSYLTGQPLAGG